MAVNFTKAVMVFFLFSALLFAQEELHPEESAEEAPLLLNIKEIDQLYNLNGLYYDEKFYVSLQEYFNILGIKNIIFKEQNRIVGFYPKQNAKYYIDFKSLEYNIRFKRGWLKRDDLFVLDNIYYVSIDILNTLFKIPYSVNFNTLSIILSGKTELPLVELTNVEMESKRDLQESGEKSRAFNYLVPHEYRFFTPGYLGYNLYHTTQKDSTNYTHSLYGGSELLYGDASFILNGNSDKELDLESSSFTQKYIYTNEYITNITLGDITSQTLRTKNFRGLKLSNRVNPYNGEFNKMNVNGFTFPNSRVEIYKNRQIAKVVFSDEQGYYSYELPIFYGSNIVDLKIYGPHGERDEISKIYRIKDTLLKKDEFYYDLSGGKNPTDDNTYLTGDIKYGLGADITIRAGFTSTQYSDTAVEDDEDVYAGLYGNYRGDITYSATYTVDKLFESTLSYLSLVSNLSLSYTHDQEQEMNRYLASYAHEFGADSLQLRATLNQYASYNEYLGNFSYLYNIVSHFYMKYINEVSSSSLANTRTSIDHSLEAYYTEDSDFLKRTFLSGATLFLKSTYNNLNDMVSTTSKLENQKDGYYYRLEYIRNHAQHSYQGGFQVRKDFKKVALSLKGSYSPLNDYSITLGLSTNFGYNDRENKLYHSYKNTHNSGGVTVTPFEDKNDNRVFDEGEPILQDSLVRLNDSLHNLSKSEDGTFHSYNTKVYEENAIQADVFSDGYFIYSPSADAIGFYSRPNKFENVYVPFHTARSISVLVQNGTGEAFSGVKLVATNRASGKKSYGVSDLDGEVYIDGLVSGVYLIEIDPIQKQNTGFELSPMNMEIDLREETDSYGHVFTLNYP